MLLFDENKLDEMSHILEAYMDLVTTLSAEGKHVLPSTHCCKSERDPGTQG